MSIMSSLFRGLVSLFIGGIIVGSLPSVSDAGEARKQPRPNGANSTKSHAAKPGPAEITGTINTRGASVGNFPADAAERHALAARAIFIEMRAVMERTIVFGEETPKADLEALRTHITSLRRELKAAERSPRSSSADLARASVTLSQEWYQDGLKIINPPSGGVLDLPLPMKVSRKADAVGTVIAQLVEKSAADVPSYRPVKASQKQPQQPQIRTAQPRSAAPRLDW